MRSFKKLLYGRIVFLKFVVAIVVCFYTYHVIRHYAVWIFANQVGIVYFIIKLTLDRFLLYLCFKKQLV